MTTTLIRTSLDGKHDLEQIVKSMVLAFSTDPLLRWIYPSEEQYVASFPGLVKLLASDNRLSIYYAKDYAGAAFWLSPGIELDQDVFAAYMKKTVLPQDLEKVATVFEQLNQAHPQAPHWYLALLGVEPSKQGEGYGSALIQSALRECDLFNQIAYLETCNPKSAAFYERHGFEIQETIQIEDCPVIFPMVRYPKSI
ncbi:Acetyltransferase [Hyella patelloides LEGE 07179]|uniref:Acetyltransferase n=1 Tax=Hyella patelloides LEGE 07179 TaxID=945734 RepID=A0A563VSC6_9CYAN|nr:GNAT family N-acetyltransferase [Hyella patelloides]VEP14311.1 Acetyltransferase [Hyella patelloides LEGE 07179]VEP14414.1 Acetyltransferase [Hyella patelloides LEGE 07179]